mmetsp:Transcript_5589/g.14002  ORF Transcript_5589/g.14002 Transcript_5589/m.14002 type:complete len:362 (+) Transcript_5589:671-1756(+)
MNVKPPKMRGAPQAAKPAHLGRFVLGSVWLENVFLEAPLRVHRLRELPLAVDPLADVLNVLADVVLLRRPLEVRKHVALVQAKQPRLADSPLIHQLEGAAHPTLNHAHSQGQQLGQYTDALGVAGEAVPLSGMPLQPRKPGIGILQVSIERYPQFQHKSPFPEGLENRLRLLLGPHVEGLRGLVKLALAEVGEMDLPVPARRRQIQHAHHIGGHHLTVDRGVCQARPACPGRIDDVRGPDSVQLLQKVLPVLGLGPAELELHVLQHQAGGHLAGDEPAPPVEEHLCGRLAVGPAILFLLEGPEPPQLRVGGKGLRREGRPAAVLVHRRGGERPVRLPELGGLGFRVVRPVPQHDLVLKLDL